MKKSCAFVGVLALLSACASAPFQRERLKAADRFAVVGFELIRKGPIDASLGGLLSPTESGGFGKAAKVEKTEHASAVYRASLEGMNRSLGWKTLRYEELAKQPAYVAAHKERMSGFRSLPTIPEGFVIHHAGDLMDWGAVERMDEAQRARLAKDLKASALVLLSLQVEPLKEGLAGLVGGAKFKPQATLRLRVYAQDGKEILWDVSNLRGEAAEGDVKIVGGAENNRGVDALILEASRKTWPQLGERYRAEPSKN